MKSYVYRPTNTLSVWAFVAIGLAIVSWAANLVFGVLFAVPLLAKGIQLDNLNEAELLALGEQFTQLETVTFALIALLVCTFLFSMVMVSIWINRSHKNARALGVAGLSSSPAMAVGSFFIPIVNLFLPYRAMKELVSGSLKANHQPPIAAKLGFWWFTWIVGNLLSRLSNKMIDNQAESGTLAELANKMVTLQQALYIDFVSEILMIMSALLLWQIMRQTNQAHQQLAQQTMQTV